MKTIYLLRHANSGWSSSSTDDFDRTLDEQGQYNAVQIGQHLAEQNILPDLILCSAAERAQETLSYICPFLPATQSIQIKDALYLASAEKLFQHIKQVDEAAESVLILAHNPGLQELAINLGGRANIDSSIPLTQLMQNFPSGALVTVNSQSEHWAKLELSASTILNFICPKDLPPVIAPPGK